MTILWRFARSLSIRLKPTFGPFQDIIRSDYKRQRDQMKYQDSVLIEPGPLFFVGVGFNLANLLLTIINDRCRFETNPWHGSLTPPAVMVKPGTKPAIDAIPSPRRP